MRPIIIVPCYPVPIVTIGEGGLTSFFPILDILDSLSMMAVGCRYQIP